MTGPKFVHDCTNIDCCTFVGRTLRCDVYRTRDGGLILRDGNDGPDYRCYPTVQIALLVAQHDAETLHAAQLAGMSS